MATISKKDVANMGQCKGCHGGMCFFYVGLQHSFKEYLQIHARYT